MTEQLSQTSVWGPKPNSKLSNTCPRGLILTALSVVLVFNTRKFLDVVADVVVAPAGVVVLDGSHS